MNVRLPPPNRLLIYIQQDGTQIWDNSSWEVFSPDLRHCLTYPVGIDSEIGASPAHSVLLNLDIQVRSARFKAAPGDLDLHDVMYVDIISHVNKASIIIFQILIQCKEPFQYIYSS